MGCTVEELLKRISSREIAEWEAYEAVAGPLGHEYSDEMLASIHEQLQTLNRLTGANFEDNPMPEPTKVPRPEDLYIAAVAEEDEEEDVYDEADVLAFDRAHFSDE